MWKIGTTLVLAFIALAGWGGAAQKERDASEPLARALLERAIKAAGGEEKLARAGTMTLKARATFTVNKGYGANFEGYFHGLEQWRLDLQSIGAADNEKEFKGSMIVNGD